MQCYKNYTDFIPNSPTDIFNIGFDDFKCFLINMLGKDTFYQAYQHETFIKSSVSSYKTSEWFKKSKIIGVNPRIVGSFFNIVKYATTFSENAIHIMPFFESGHEDSLYVQNSWRISNEFFDNELAKDGFDTIEKQLKVTVNLLHSLGKVVGFDSLPHVDNFSEIVFLNPKYFEWIKLNKDRTAQIFPPELDYNKVYLGVEKEIINFIKKKNPDIKFNEKDFFNNKVTDENTRHSIIFGNNSAKWNTVRLALINHIRSKGYETLPVTEHAPSRPIVFDKIVYKNSSNWAKFKVKNKSKDAVILGCVTPYKWYKIDNEGYPDTDKYEAEVWEYFISKYKKIQGEFNFDFMRGDMAHNQISHSSKKISNKPKKEFWKTLKKEIQKNAPYFATLAEAFNNTYYIDGYSDMANKDFDVILGNLNYQFLNENYINHIKDFITVYPQHFAFAPCICVFSNDADKKENNIFYQSPLANEIRMFCAYFLETPSYMGMGYELRNLQPKRMCEYSFNYIKSKKEPYKWGDNEEFLSSINEMREIYIKIRNEINKPTVQLCKTNNDSALAWLFFDEYKQAKYLFCFNLRKDEDNLTIDIYNKEPMPAFIKGCYSNMIDDFENTEFQISEKGSISLRNFPIGSCCILTIN